MYRVQIENPPPVLLLNADYYGTLAAVRCFGRLGIPVTVAETKFLAPAKWSKYVSKRVPAPHVRDADRFLDWLLEFGRRQPGHVLHPTSDDMAWFLALHRDRLSTYYRMYLPPVDCIYRILNKKLLHTLCQELQIATPETVVPADQADLQARAQSLSYPVMLKPQTQLFFETFSKGSLIHAQEELFEAYLVFREENTYADILAAFDPEVGWPMLQRYYPEATDRIYNLSGFIDTTGELVALRASRKILQIPRRLGTGVCFEEDVVHPELRESVIALCQRIGYHGIFEVEFIQTVHDGRYLLTDFNPRFYKQMAFDVTRGLPLPALIYYAAVSNDTKLCAMVEAAQVEHTEAANVFCHRFIFSLMLTTQKLSGALSAREAQRWQRWFSTHRRSMTDAVVDPRDRLPALIDNLTHILRICRHPKGFVLGTILDR